MRRFVVGTRGSRLALAQTGQVIAELRRLRPEVDARLEIISTRGDQQAAIPLSQVGQKGIFTKELEAALLDRRIDVAVHSAKDLPSPTPPGLEVVCVPLREDPRDALVCGPQAPRPGAPSIADRGLELLRPGALVGTSSLRRQAQLRLLRPDLRFTLLRGNIETRIARVRSGDCDATLLALAGLRRGGLSHDAATILDPAVMVPAPGQGVLALEGRSGDADVRAWLQVLHDRASGLALRSERQVVEALAATCTTPIGVLARIDGGRMAISAIVAAPDGTRAARAQVVGPIEDADRLAAELTADLRALGAAEIVAAFR